MNSLIMQLEIEHEDHAAEDCKETIEKESKYTKSSTLEFLNNKQLEAALQAFVLFANHYPLDVQYTFELMQPPEQA